MILREGGTGICGLINGISVRGIFIRCVDCAFLGGGHPCIKCFIFFCSVMVL